MLSYKKVFFIFLFNTVSLIANAQAVNTDSLKFIIKFNPKNVEKVKAYKALANAMLFKDFDECQAAAVAGAALAGKLKDPSSVAELKKYIGLSWYFKGSYDSAAVYYYIAMDILKKTDAPAVKAGVLNELGKL